MPFKKSVAFLVLVGALVGLAVAHDDDDGPAVQVTMSAVPPSVTLSRPALATFAAYSVTIKNKSGSTLSQISFAGTTAVGGLQANQSGIAPFFNSVGLDCSATNANLTSISCPVGELNTGASISFTVSFKAPSIGSSISFGSTTSFSSYQYQYSRARVSTSSVTSGSVDKSATTALVVFDPNHVIFYVPAGGGTVFTGTTGNASRTEPSTTLVTLPTTAPATTVELLVAADPNSCSADLTQCFISTLTIPGTFDNLTIKLRRDGSTIKPGANIANAVIFYAHDKVHFAQIFACTSTGPSPGVPCIALRKVNPKPGAFTPGTVGGWEFTILAKDNGSYRG